MASDQLLPKSFIASQCELDLGEKRAFRHDSLERVDPPFSMTYDSPPEFAIRAQLPQTAFFLWIG
jgi:hypothetical protein